MHIVMIIARVSAVLCLCSLMFHNSVKPNVVKPKINHSIYVCGLDLLLDIAQNDNQSSYNYCVIQSELIFLSMRLPLVGILIYSGQKMPVVDASTVPSSSPTSITSFYPSCYYKKYMETIF